MVARVISERERERDPRSPSCPAQLLPCSSGAEEMAHWKLPRAAPVAPPEPIRKGRDFAMHWALGLPCRYGDKGGASDCDVEDHDGEYDGLDGVFDDDVDDDEEDRDDAAADVIMMWVPR